MASTFDENKQPLSEDRYFMISTFHEYKLLKHRRVPYFEDISHLKVCSQELERSLEEKEKELTKEKLKILEERRLVIQQDKILQDMQLQLRHLEEQLRHPEPIGLKTSKPPQNQTEAVGAGSSQQGEKVHNCPSSPAQKIATVKLAQKSMTSYLKRICFHLGHSLWLFVRLLLCFGCAKYLQVQSIYKSYYETCLGIH